MTDGPDVEEPADLGPIEEPDPRKIRVNELMVENTGTLSDEEGNFPPWVELYNPTNLSVDLAGSSLSDSLFNPNKWLFPEGGEAVIEPRGFLVVFVDGRSDELGGLHASFSLSRGPLTTILYRGIDSVTVDTSGLPADRSLGLFPDGEGRDFLLLESATPAAANAEPDPDVGPVEGPFVRGDLNADGNVAFSDTVVLLRVVRGLEDPPPCADRADVNDDGVIDEADYTLLSQAVFDGSIDLPAPFPAAGLDPTPDALACPL